ncbi:AN1-type zinc finger protein 2B-like protein [Gorgonomyces haynaldii]|nr:AN1-type zinc finger protein 2B-like protein [Gorgonomyces haynaldii]
MELPHLGKHCSQTNCHQLDFLPFKCYFCQQEFCLEHSKANPGTATNGHFCPKHPKDARAVICPACSQVVPTAPGQDPNETVYIHLQSGCREKPKVYQNQCSYKGCTKREMVPIVCHSCSQKFCLKHRHEQDHQCKRRQGSQNSVNSQSSFKGKSGFARRDSKKECRVQ